MNSRRRFFRSLAQAAALIALAPQLAFRVRPEVVSATVVCGWQIDGAYICILNNSGRATHSLYDFMMTQQALHDAGQLRP